MDDCFRGQSPTAQDQASAWTTPNAPPPQVGSACAAVPTTPPTVCARSACRSLSRVKRPVSAWPTLAARNPRECVCAMTGSTTKMADVPEVSKADFLFQ